jgi:hypothetical protein
MPDDKPVRLSRFLKECGAEGDGPIAKPLAREPEQTMVFG